VTTDNATAEPLVTTAAADYDVESVRAEWVGRVVATSTGRYPVEFPRNEQAYLQLTLKPVDREPDPEPDPVTTR